MAKCTVTLNVAKLGVAYASGSMGVAPAAARDDGTYWITGETVRVPLANSPLSTVSVDQGQVYAYITPDGEMDYRLTPALASEDYSDLEIVSWIPPSGGILGDSVVDEVLSNPASDSYATLLAFIEDHPGPAGPGNTDAGTAGFVNNGTATKTALGDEAADDTSPLSLAIAELITSGTSGKQDTFTLAADAAAHVDDGSELDDALYTKITTLGDPRYLPSAVAAPSLVVDRPSGVLEGRVFLMYGPSRGVTGNATRIHFDRLKGRINCALFSNQSVGGHQAADTVSRMYGSPLSIVQGTAADAATITSQVGTWLNKAMWAGILLWWPFGNDALWDGAPGSASTTAKARASAANALHAGICLARSEQRIEGYLTLSMTTTNGSATITASSGNKWYRGMLVTAAGVPANTYVGTILSATSFKLSSSRTSQVDTLATASATVTGALSAVVTGTWVNRQNATAPDLYFSGNSNSKTLTNGDTKTYVIWVDAADAGRHYWWVTAGIDDAEYVAVAAAPFGGTGGSTYSVTVDGGTAITGTTSDQHRWTGIAGGLTYGATFGQKAVDLGTLATGQHTIVITNTGATGKLLMDDCVLVESLTPLTIQLMKEVELPALYYAAAIAVANGASYAKTQIYNTIIDTEVAKWPNDKSVLSKDISADNVNGTYDKSIHISTIDGTWAHFDDAGERLDTDKLMGDWNALPERAGFTRI